MASSSGSRRPAALPPPPPETAEQQRCPRCNSLDTKFCYYNNYNLSQPRHFCKSCRRYWTLGGSLRNIPVGGTTRKSTRSYSSSSKRRRQVVSAAPSPSSSSPSTSAVDQTAPPLPAVAPLDPVLAADQTTAAGDVAGTFAALLSEPLPAGFLALGDSILHGGASFELDLGLGLGGIEEIGFGQGSTAWPFLGDDMERGADMNGFAGSNGGGDTWHVSGAGDDGGAWPDLAISTSGTAVVAVVESRKS